MLTGLAESDVGCQESRLIARDPVSRERYLQAALAQIPRLLGAIDRNPYRPTYGCLDRQFWHYRTSPFPSEMYQEGVLPLALVAATRLPGNRWYGEPRVRELAVAGLHFAANSCHRDGSCDDYYPFERALGAAAFSFAAATEAYRLLRLNDADLLAWFRRRATWLMRHDESGRLANHQALVALGLARLETLTGERAYGDAAAERVERILSWQSSEGWFDEYGGADPGYQTVTIDCLAKYKTETDTSPTRKRGSGGPVARGGAPSLARRASVGKFDEALHRAVSFARLFLHPDDSYGGPYGSRGTYHFYPHGMELLAGEDANAADLADGFVRAIDASRRADGQFVLPTEPSSVPRQAYFDDDRMYAHRLGNLIEAYRDWSPQRSRQQVVVEQAVYLPCAGMLVRRTARGQTVISAARGGVFKHVVEGSPVITDAGLIVELDDGRIAVSQQHEPPGRSGLPPARNAEQRTVCYSQRDDRTTLTVAGPLHVVSFETATPLKQALLHLGMCTVGRPCRTSVRKLLQRRLISGRRAAPLRLTRRIELTTGTPTLRVTDTIELTAPTAHVQRMSFGTDHEAAYVAASGVYQESVLQPWTDLGRYVSELNERRRVTIVREW
jgi:hypothetical protein